jgi:hypothetical protein
MKTAALLYGRNDGYKENERLIIHINSLLETFDEVHYLDWNSDDNKGSVLNQIKDKLISNNRLKHYVIPASIVSQIYNNIEGIGACISPLIYNILLRRCDADWIVCTTNDIIAPKKEMFESFLSKADPQTFYTLSRRDIEIKDVAKFGFNKWKEYRDILDQTTKERRLYAKVTPNDNFSIINCCGDFQLASKHVWTTIKGYEENMYYACFSDTNIQKKAVLNGFNLEAIYDVPLYHMSHLGMGNDGSSPSKQKYNDPWKWVEFFEESQNEDNWGLADTEIEFEII